MKRWVALCCGILGCPAPIDVVPEPDLRPSVAPPTAEPQPDRAPKAYFKTEDSNAWVAENFKLQTAYARVLLVGEPKVASVSIAPPSLGPGSQGAKPHAVDASFATIQAAIDASKPGDLIAVQPGRYGGFVLGGVAGAGDGAFTFVRALGPPGAVVIDGPSYEKNWMIYVRGGHHAVIEGFHLVGSGQRSGPRAGIMLDGDFGQSGRLVRNVAIVNVLADAHRTWGMHSTDTATVLVQDSAFGRSVEEHGLYVSDGSDDWVIRRNVFFENYAGGVQINLDPLASLEEVVRHVGMMGSKPFANSRTWAQGILARADKEYGANNYPDGRGINFIVEDNVAYGNGKKGGAAYNFAAISESLIQRNLAYDNHAGGLVLWDNHNPFDMEFVDDQPSSVEEWVPDRKPIFGSRDNLVRYNTFFDEPSRRAAIQCRNGSFGNRFIGNIAVHGKGPGLWVTADSLERLEAKGNVMGFVEIDKDALPLTSLAKLMPEKGSRADATFAGVAAALVAPSAAPWIVLEGGWFKPNPSRPDFRRKADALRPLPGTDELGAFGAKN